MKKTTNEKILEATEKKQQLENQLKNLLQQQKTEERKARTKRLIERGAILESLIPNAETLENDHIKEILIQALCAPKPPNPAQKQPTLPAAQPVKSAQPPSGADGGRTGETATFGD